MDEKTGDFSLIPIWEGKRPLNSLTLVRRR